MSRDFIILTDSASDLDVNYLKRNDIELIKLGYNINNEDYAGEEEKDLDVQEFYRILKEGAMPKTSQVNVGIARKHFEKYLNEKKDVLYDLTKNARKQIYTIDTGGEMWTVSYIWICFFC